MIIITLSADFDVLSLAMERFFLFGFIDPVFTHVGLSIAGPVFTVRKNSEDATDEELGRLEVVGEYHLGNLSIGFWHGSFVMRLPDSYVGQIPTVIFGTVNGVIGVISSLPQEHYAFLEKLQTNLRQVIKGVGGPSHEQWRSFNNEKKTSDTKNFMDGRSYRWRLEKLCKRVELTRLH
ncbi:hypothetical protein M0R45_008649 [Rubus argutus]|uniref:RSE1/DDB1/CPSF1 C-terminal domain-containing protein n=1 Tax=Rubus argutus TaxID=59490 RepID=A0AAW1Y2C4_RUBAR